MQTRNQESIFILALATVCILIYLPSLPAPFIFDDKHMIVGNSLIKHPAEFKKLFQGYVTSDPATPKGMLRPLLMLTFAANYATSGLNPIGYHIFNILIHFLNALLIYFTLKHLTKNIQPSAAAGVLAFLFAVHPINSETVTYISCRSDLLAVFFILAGFLLYLKNRHWACLLVYLPALLTKETALCLPILIAAHELILRPKERPAKKTFFVGAIFIITTLIYLSYRAGFFEPSAPRVLRSPLTNIFLQSGVTMFYLGMFIWPTQLNILHDLPITGSLNEPLTILSTIAVILLAVLAIRLRKNFPWQSLGLAWFLIGLLPKFYAPLHFPACEHHLYLPSIGLYILAMPWLSGIWNVRKKYLPCVLTAIAAIFIALTSIRSAEYADPLVFWHVSAERNPGSATIANQLGAQYFNLRLYQEAEQQFVRTLELSQRIEDTINAKINLSNIYIIQAKYPQALAQLTACLKLRKVPAPGVYHNIGVIYWQAKNYPLAETAWAEELRLYPASFATCSALGRLYLKLGENEKGRKLLLQADQLNPDR